MTSVLRDQDDAERARIVDAASATMRAQGIAETSVSEVALDAGVTPDVLHRHFASRDDLVEAVIETALDAVAAQLRALIGPDRGRAAVEPFVRGYLSLDHVRFPDKGCPIATLGIEAALGPMRYRQAMARGRDRVVAELAKGFVAPPEVARAKAETLLAALVGTVMMARHEGDWAARERLLNDTLETLLAALWSDDAGPEPSAVRR